MENYLCWQSLGESSRRELGGSKKSVLWIGGVIPSAPRAVGAVSFRVARRTVVTFVVTVQPVAHIQAQPFAVPSRMLRNCDCGTKTPCAISRHIAHPIG